VLKIKFTNFFKKKQIEQETINLCNLSDWIKTKEKTRENKQKQIIKIINNNIKTLKEDINKKIKILRGVNIDSKKVENRMKVIVKGNLNSYIHNINILTKNLSNLNQENLQDLTEQINKVFFNFKKNSDLNYQKATFLIGKEMAEIQKTLFDFSKELAKIIKKNKETIQSSKQLSLIKTNLLEFNQIKTTIKEFNEKITQSNEKITLKDNQIKEIKTSKDYKDNLKKQQEIKDKNKQYFQEISQLKSLINFKKLCNIFHSSENMMNIIKSYKERFESSLTKDEGTELLELLDESKLNTSTIKEKINTINKLKEYKTQKTNPELTKINHLNQQIEHLKQEIIEEKKRINKIKTNKQTITTKIEQELNNINIKLIK